MNIYSIYKITNVITGMHYIGKSVNPIVRYRTHISEANRNMYHHYFHNSIRKYGAENFIFEIIDSTDNEKIAYKKEKYWIKFYDTVSPKGYNSNAGGKGGSCGIKMSDETIAKRTASLKPRGWYITPEGKFKSANQHFFSTNSIQRYCKNPDKIISLNSYSKSKYLQSIGNYIDLKEKTYRDIGFWYEPN